MATEADLAALWEADSRSGFFLTRCARLAVNPAMSPEEPPPDPTPIVGAATDISPLTHAGPKPAHERTAAEEAGTINWERIAASRQFRELLRAKCRFVVPAMIVFIVYYFALLVLVGYAGELMETRLLGPVNLAYLFALSQFFMAWIIAALYVRAANRFDRQAKGIIEKQP
jgi:uncharacterized membrane protein (DUF485 family)